MPDTGMHAASGTHLSTNTLPKMAPNTTPTTKIVEPYHVIEGRITQAIDALRERCRNPNIAATARVTATQLRARWNGHQAKSDIIPCNRKLQVDQESAVCSYLDRLDKIAIPARTFMITYCANSILRHATGGDGPPPVVSENWARGFLKRH